ncbi:hypothetical protein [Methanobrevibacter filiformis]|uniref:Uncharacterized protein n=1 Tax=Methanobrevibacter filiformis TaxID=55758 RepID=A0A166F0X2_9EURY|nr:hypothetical protein [Methanobrevibacter filiformis]KZX17209.1 hypothetical protein MBFIL_02790 [Methanobrevibacter filiformis]
MSGKELVKSLEKEYGSNDVLERAFNRTENMKLEMDLENWEYFLKHPAEEIEQQKIIYAENPDRIFQILN